MQISNYYGNTLYNVGTDNIDRMFIFDSICFIIKYDIIE